MEKIKIFPAVPAMLEDMAQLECLCFSDPWSRAALSDALESTCGLWLCAYHGDCLVGALGAQVLEPEAEILSVGVHPDFRRQGIARQLLIECFARIRAVKTVYLEVRRSNFPAQALYTSFGFACCGIRKSYYEHPVEDAIMMSWNRPEEELW